MQEKDKLGQTGEEAACLFLIQQGRSILARNIRFGNLEIDIIAEHDREIELIEVKTRASNCYGRASDALNRQKIQNMKKAASLYANAQKISLERITLSFIAIDYVDNMANIKYYYDFLA